MKIIRTDSRDGIVVIQLEDEHGNAHEIELGTITVAQLIGGLRASLEEAIGHPSANSMMLPGMVRVQIVSHETEVWLRIYLNDRVSHDYPVPTGTYLADELKLLSDRVEAHNSARATHQSPDNCWGKN